MYRLVLIQIKNSGDNLVFRLHYTICIKFLEIIKITNMLSDDIIPNTIDSN